MNEKVQIIAKDGEPEWAIVPFETYQRLVEDADMLQDILDYDNSRAAIERGEEELVPSEVTYAILDGENPVKVWREHRRLTQGRLAQAAGVSTPYLSQIERGRRSGTLEVLSAIARVLEVSLDDIVLPPRTS